MMQLLTIVAMRVKAKDETWNVQVFFIFFLICPSPQYNSFQCVDYFVCPSFCQVKESFMEMPNLSYSGPDHLRVTVA